jgi:lysophosphatidate acyltransferase
MWSILAYPLYFLLTYTVIMLGFLTAHTTMPNAPNIFGFIARSMLAYLALLICAAYGTIASAVLRIFNSHYAYGQWTTAKAFKYIGGTMTGVHFEIMGNGEELLNKERPMVLLGNHQTELDILMLGSIWPQHCSVTAKKSLRNVPFLGWFMSLSGTVFIDRVDRT